MEFLATVGFSVRMVNEFGAESLRVDRDEVVVRVEIRPRDRPVLVPAVSSVFSDEPMLILPQEHVGVDEGPGVDPLPWSPSGFVG